MIKNNYEKNFIIDIKDYTKVLFYEKNEKIRRKKARRPSKTKNDKKF